MRGVWTIARQLIAEGLRMHTAHVFGLFMFCVVFIMPLFIEGDGSVTGAVQNYLSFCLTFVSGFLGLLAIFLSKSISDELVQRQAFTVLTKPVSRWQYVVGKWLGIVLLCWAYLAIAAGGALAMAHWIAATRTPIDDAFTRLYKDDTTIARFKAEQAEKVEGAGATEPAGNDLGPGAAKGEAGADRESSADIQRLETEVFVARHASALEVPDFRDLIEKEFQKRLEEGAYQNVENFDPVDARKAIGEKLYNDWRYVSPYDRRVLHFKNVLCDRSPDSLIQLRFQVEVMEYQPDEIFRSYWGFGNPQKAPTTYEVWGRHAVGRWATIRVPADCVAEDFTLDVLFYNINPFADPNFNVEGPLEFFLPTPFEIRPDALEVLFNVGSFWGNYLRMVSLMLLRVSFLAALGVLMTSLFSFPVACLACFTAYGLAAIRGFILESLDWASSKTDSFIQAIEQLRSKWSQLAGTELVEAVGRVFTEGIMDLMRLILHIVPNFSAYDGLENLVNGRNVPLAWVMQGFGVLGLLQTGIVLGLAVLLFRRREIAETSF